MCKGSIYHMIDKHISWPSSFKCYQNFQTVSHGKLSN